MMSKICVPKYIQIREQGVRVGSRRLRCTVEQNLLVNNPLETKEIADVNSELTIRACLIAMSVDKNSFAVSISDKFIGIFCSISGLLKFKLIGLMSHVYTISWHPILRNVIASSDVSGNFYVWDFSDKKTEHNYLHCWRWPIYSGKIYAIDFHQFNPIISIARDREVRFINWMKGEQMAVWRFYSEFSYVSWVSWSVVGESILVSVGNPADSGVLHSLVESVESEKFNFSPVFSGCRHHGNSLCEICDISLKMSYLESEPPSFEEYNVNAVDLIRFVLSRPSDWFIKIYICPDCRPRFQNWADSTQIHEKYKNAKLNERNNHILNDVDSDLVTIMESPIAPEVMWDYLQTLDVSYLPDSRLGNFIIPKNELCLHDECRNLLRTVAMFERECLRRSICWCCVQQIHRWILQQHDFPRFLYQSMLSVREMVTARMKRNDLNVFEHQTGNTEREMKHLVNRNQFHDSNHGDDERDRSLSNDEIISDNEFNSHANVLVKLSDSLENAEGQHKIELTSNSESNNRQFCNLKLSDGIHVHQTPFEITVSEKVRLKYLKVTLKLLQMYVSEPSTLGDMIKDFLNRDLNRRNQSHYFNPSKVDSYSIRRWHLQPTSDMLQKILPRFDHTDSNIVVPALVFSKSGLITASIRPSKCGRMVAVLVSRDSFNRLHFMEYSNSLCSKRKRRYSSAFNDSLNIENLQSVHKPHVIAVYSSEPESSCGHLLYYFHPHYDPISLDFSPLGDLLLVGLSMLSQSPRGISKNTDIAAILKIHSDDAGCSIPNNSKDASCFPMEMRVCRFLKEKNPVEDSGVPSSISCIIWNTAGGMLYSKNSGSLYSVNYLGYKS